MQWKGSLEPGKEKEWVPCLGKQNHGLYIGIVDVFLVVFPVEIKEKPVFRMLRGDDSQGFICKPSDAIQSLI